MRGSARGGKAGALGQQGPRAGSGAPKSRRKATGNCCEAETKKGPLKEAQWVLCPHLLVLTWFPALWLLLVQGYHRAMMSPAWNLSPCSVTLLGVYLPSPAPVTVSSVYAKSLLRYPQLWGYSLA